ncbi:HAD family hydrolase [Cellulosilyticum sp. I15G10I2]|uniref:HAD family hydrolase n=1 Tax=Cellulosilyticum sp. I15G10I2 TaxID=1892843 RepID=UPI00085C0B1D|nr:HAD-IIIA family hydrolase [Cellulosilyticum sp. I15G10I2]
MYRLVIFDLDGTLLDTLTDLAYAGNYVLRQWGFEEHLVDNYKNYIGNGVYKLVERMLPEECRNEKMIEKARGIFEEYYKVHSLDHTKPYEGIITLLHTLKEQGVLMAVASNKPDIYTKELVGLMFEDKITLAFGQRIGVIPKPDPQVILDILEHFKVDKSECIYIGDSDVDMYTAKNAGVTSVGVLWGYRTREELIESGAHYIVSEVKGLEELILNGEPNN